MQGNGAINKDVLKPYKKGKWITLFANKVLKRCLVSSKNRASVCKRSVTRAGADDL